MPRSRAHSAFKVQRSAFDVLAVARTGSEAIIHAVWPITKKLSLIPAKNQLFHLRWKPRKHCLNPRFFHPRSPK
jgi:hypothetical protein